MEYPGLELAKLSDDNIANKISEIHGKLLHVQSFGGNPIVMNQLMAILETLEFEQDLRRNRKAWEAELKESGVQIETEADLKPKKEIPTAQKKSNKTGFSAGSLFKKTAEPTKDILGD